MVEVGRRIGELTGIDYALLEEFERRHHEPDIIVAGRLA